MTDTIQSLLQGKMPGTGLLDTEPTSFDPVELRAERLAKVRRMLRDKGYGACVLFEPYNQRYATGSRNMFGYFLRNSTRYFFIGAEGPVILFEYPQSTHVSEVLETVDECRTSKVVWSSVTGRDNNTSGPFADEISALVREYGGGSLKVGMDRCSYNLALQLADAGCEPQDCQQDLLNVRAVKTDNEITCLKLSMISTEAGLARLRSAIAPGKTEQEVWAELYHSILVDGGDFIETRLLSSGERTNPWFNECGPKKIRPGDLVAVDTDTIGVYGYFSDISRTFHCGPGRPTATQKELYQMAYDQIQHNISILKPGMGFREVSEKAWDIPEKYYDRRYTSVMHGVGMHGETPLIPHLADFDKFGSDGVLEPNMVLSVESYIGEVGGKEGVKLEEELRITEDGVELISQFPFEEDLMLREV